MRRSWVTHMVMRLSKKMGLKILFMKDWAAGNERREVNTDQIRLMIHQWLTYLSLWWITPTGCCSYPSRSTLFINTKWDCAPNFVCRSFVLLTASKHTTHSCTIFKSHIVNILTDIAIWSMISGNDHFGTTILIFTEERMCWVRVGKMLANPLTVFSSMIWILIFKCSIQSAALQPTWSLLTVHSVQVKQQQWTFINIYKPEPVRSYTRFSDSFPSLFSWWKTTSTCFLSRISRLLSRRGEIVTNIFPLAPVCHGNTSYSAWEAKCAGGFKER